jgi:predicted transcriptional regulator
MNITMEELDTILELINDSQWHSIEEIQKEVNLPSDKLNGVIRFLQEQAFVDKQNGSLRITSAGLRLLELPA